MSGAFITFEGIEGAGKTTQIEDLARRLRALGQSVVMLREPGGTPLGEEIRALFARKPGGQEIAPEAEALLVNAGRAQLIHQVVQPALDRGAIVLCDRHTDSTIAYQSYGRGLPLAHVRELNAWTVGNLAPDRTYYLKISLTTSGGRRLTREKETGTSPDRMELENRDFFERVLRGFDELAAEDPERIATIDAERRQDEVGELIWADLLSRLSDRLKPPPAVVSR